MFAHVRCIPQQKFAMMFLSKCVYVEKFCVSKLYDDKLCMNSCGQCIGLGREEATGGTAGKGIGRNLKLKTRTQTKIWGFNKFYIKN